MMWRQGGGNARKYMRLSAYVKTFIDFTCDKSGEVGPESFAASVSSHPPPIKAELALRSYDN